MKTFKAALLATVLATSATIAYGQVNVDAGADATVDGTVSSGAGDSSTSVGTGVDTNATADANAAAEVDAADGNVVGSYADLSTAISSSTTVDLYALSNVSDINVVLISSLAGEADASGWADLKSMSTASIQTLHDNIEKNGSLNTQLTAELTAAGDFTIEDVVAVSVAADGSLTVYVDDAN